ncbi:hypothetical protein GC197_14605 [bacterium]|nr:hypothetical protein [bacterium]
MSKAAVGFRNGELVVDWRLLGTPSIEGLTDPEIIDAETAEDALAAYDAVKGTNLAVLQAKQGEVDAWWQNELAHGYVTTSFGVELGWSDVDRNAVNQGIALLNEAIALGTMTLSNLVPGWVDRNGQAIKINEQDPTALQLKQMAVEMGVAYNTQRGLHLGYNEQLAAGNANFTVGEAL